MLNTGTARQQYRRCIKSALSMQIELNLLMQTIKSLVSFTQVKMTESLSAVNEMAKFINIGGGGGFVHKENKNNSQCFTFSRLCGVI